LSNRCARVFSVDRIVDILGDHADRPLAAQGEVTMKLGNVDYACAARLSEITVRVAQTGLYIGESSTGSSW
jgi:hypothetical protein